MERKIEDVHLHYENLVVKFVGDKARYFMSPYKLVGAKVNGKVVPKRTRTWFE
jgi:hypothetical protein